MTQINLLPWREQARQAKKLQFIYMLAGAVGIAILLILLLHLHFNSLIQHQNRRNIFLQSELDREQTALTQMNDEKKRKAIEEDALKTLFNIRKSGYQVISMLDQVAKSVPEGVLLSRIVRKNHQVTIIGRSNSNAQITLFIKNLSRAALFKKSELSEISAKELGSGEERIFQLNIELDE